MEAEIQKVKMAQAEAPKTPEPPKTPDPLKAAVPDTMEDISEAPDFQRHRAAKAGRFCESSWSRQKRSEPPKTPEPPKPSSRPRLFFAKPKGRLGWGEPSAGLRNTAVSRSQDQSGFWFYKG